MCLSSWTMAFPVGLAKRLFCSCIDWGSATTMAVSWFSFRGLDEGRSELEKAMPCFFGFRMRERSLFGVSSSSCLFPTLPLFLGDWPRSWLLVVTVGVASLSSSLSLSGLLRRILRLLLARNIGPAVSSVMIAAT